MNYEEMLNRLSKGEDPLELSVEKWQDILSGEGEARGVENCALCWAYRGEVNDEFQDFFPLMPAPNFAATAKRKYTQRMRAIMEHCGWQEKK